MYSIMSEGCWRYGSGWRFAAGIEAVFSDQTSCNATHFLSLIPGGSSGNGQSDTFYIINRLILSGEIQRSSMKLMIR